MLCKLTWKHLREIKVVITDNISPFQTSDSLVLVILSHSVYLGEASRILQFRLLNLEAVGSLLFCLGMVW